MSATKHVLPHMGIVLMLAGCGTYVPEIQENPWNLVGGQLLVQKIIESIQCEVKDAITYIINQDLRLSRIANQPPQTDWLRAWGVQMQLTLTVDEKSTVSPSGVYTPMQIFFLGLGANLSSQATRINTLNYYNIVSDIYGNGKEYCHPIDIEDAATGSLLIQSDLKLKEWLASIVLARGTAQVPFTPNRQNGNNGFSHEVTFEIVTSANIAPMWKLVHAAINQSGPLFSVNRDRKNDLIITFGPNNPITNSLQTTAAGTFLAAQIGLANRSQTINPGSSP